MRDWVFLQLQMRLWRKWRHIFMRIVANSHSVRASLIADGIESVDVIHNGVAVESFMRELSSKPVVVFAGRLVPEKGVDVLLNAFAIVTQDLPEARLLIAGAGPEYARLLELTDKLSISSKVTFLGHIPKRKMETHFAQAWVQVVPSRWAEPFGLVAVEGMMRGTAVIASSMGGLNEIIKPGETGFLVPPNDIGALAGKMKALLSDPAKAREMGESGRNVAVSRFNLARQCEEFATIYQEMVLTHRSSVLNEESNTQLSCRRTG
jgi:glycosyltransferase involved in cell wall biosynthesis